MGNRITIKTLAKDLGISHMTVSRALSNHPNVRSETREIVQKRASELGYVRSVAATAMRGDGTRIVGLLLPNIVNEFYARFANALALQCEENNLHLITHLTNDDETRERLSLQKLRELQADAVILVPAPGQVPLEERYLQDMRVVQLIRTKDIGRQYSQLTVKDTDSIAEAVDHLAEKGHRYIGYIGAHEVLSSGRQRLAAFTSALKRNELDPRADLIRTDAPSFEMGFNNTNTILDSSSNVTALVCGGFEISNGALDACLRRDVKMPDDLAFVGYGDPSFYQWIQGGITTITLPVEDLATQAVELLLPSTDIQMSEKFSYPTSLQIRHST